jgi:hypothetical protein
MQSLWIFESVNSNSLSITDAKTKIRPIQNQMNGSSGSGNAGKGTTANKQGFVNEFSEYSAGSATTYTPSNPNSYSNYQPASYANMNVNAANTNSYSSYSNVYSASQVDNNVGLYDQYAPSGQPDNRRLSAGSAGSGAQPRMPRVPSGAPEQLYRAESFYRAPASTVLPPTAPTNPRNSLSTATTMASYSSSSNLSANSGYANLQQPGPMVPPQPQQTRGFALPVYKDPFNGATISQPTNPGSRLTSQSNSRTNSRSNSRSSTPERFREFSTSNALIEGMLQTDAYEAPAAPAGQRQSVGRANLNAEYYSEDRYSAYTNYKQPGYPSHESGSPTSVYNSNQSASHSTASSNEPVLTRIPATKMMNNAANYQGSFSSTYTASTVSTGTASAAATTTSASNNPFDSFC